MKTFNNALENFAKEAITETEMNFVRGGGAINPLDLTVPPKGER